MGSEREVVRLTRARDAYRWICGGVDVNYHAVNDFRSDDGELLDELHTGNVAAVGAPTLPQLFVTEVRA